VTQLVLPLHEAAADTATAKSATEPLRAAADPAAASAAPTKTSCLCVQV
jgi:hypothetical protein